MNNNFEFNKIESNNAEQLKPKPYYSANYIGQTQNKTDIQQPSQEAENKVERKEKEVKTTQAKAATTSKLLTTFVAAVSSVVIGVTSISGILPEPTTLTARFEETYATDHEIYYMVEIGDSRFNEQDESGREKMQYEEEYNEDEDYVIDLTDLYVVLYNDFTERSEKIEEQFWSGVFEHLQENMTYTLEVKYKNNVLASKTLKTVLQKSDYEDDYDPDEPYTEPTNDDPDEPYTEPTNSDDPDEPIMSDGDGGDYDPGDPDNTNNYDPDDPDNPDYNEPDDPDDPDNPNGNDDPTNNTGGDNTGGSTGGDDPTQGGN